MYDFSNDADKDIINCRKLFNDDILFRNQCRLVIKYWPKICQMVLNNKSMNRVAWLGQAAASYYKKIPEIITKEVWKTLDNNVKNNCNKIASACIIDYEKSNK